MLSMNPYLNFDGRTEEAMNFYKSVLGGEFVAFQRFNDVPGTEKMSDADRNKIMHICLVTGDGLTLMATDTMESMGQKLELGNNLHIALHTSSEKEADTIFNGLSAGGKVSMPLSKTFWDAYFGMFIDQFGVSWMINHTYEKK